MRVVPATPFDCSSLTGLVTETDDPYTVTFTPGTDRTAIPAQTYIVEI